MDTGIKQPAIKSLLDCKTLEKFTIKRPAETQRKQRQNEGNYSVSRYVEVKHLHNTLSKMPWGDQRVLYQSNVLFVVFKGGMENGWGLKTVS